MSVKRVAEKINAYCTFCKASGELKVPARWRRSWDHSNRACDAHKPSLDALEAAERLSDSHHSEADYQTWMRY